MGETLKVALIQSDLIWEDAAANRANFEQKLNQLTHLVDLVVLPEMFSTGFTMNARAVAEPMDGKTVQWMQKIVKSKNVALIGSLVIEEDNKFYNRAIFVTPDGVIKYYDKHQLFTMAGEHETYTPGQEIVVIEYRGWRIRPLICYDLRFPVWARNTSNADVLVYMANWPEKRIQAWDTLLKARAIENMVYCVGVNRVGRDAKGHNYIGHSAVYDILGNAVISDTPVEQEIILYATLTKTLIKETRKKLPFLKDADSFIISKK
ncbi:amidohydrolase [Aquimarina sp. W85]|uniref:amidohydrolase n=1 Tax=Aquimarina rhodophyticola TaxID=3342246 RepID=UPI00366AAEDF